MRPSKRYVRALLGLERSDSPPLPDDETKLILSTSFIIEGQIVNHYKLDTGENVIGLDDFDDPTFGASFFIGD